jgi:integrase
MEVVNVKTEDGKERYYVADNEGLPVEPILKFIRFKDNTNYARNTLRMYCQHLKLYFEYLEEYSNNVSERLKKFVSTPSRNFKGFLYGIAHANKKVASNILKLKVPKSKPKVLSKEEIETLIYACNNLRDKFLLTLLYETGMRIGEALSLWIEELINQKILL